MRKIVIVFLSIITVSCATYKRTNDRALRVREGNVNLYLYAPYVKNTQAALLDTISALKMETDLPLLNGAAALYPVYAAFAQAVYPKKKYDLDAGEVVCNNTIQAYKKLINKTADIIFVAPPSKEQLEEAKKAGVSFRYTPIGKEAFVFFVNSQNPVSDLTIEQLQGIYSGEITNWKELGGNDEIIRPFQRNENSGSQTAFVHFMQGKTIMQPPKEDVVQIMVGIVSQTADYTNYGNAIGFSFRYYVNEMVKNEDVKILKINGVFPELETIGNNTYPLSSSFFAVTLIDNYKPNVTRFLEWIVSEQGQYLVKETGYYPIKLVVAMKKSSRDTFLEPSC
jgi:ABC-type phosphate transport system, periplasmic component